MGKALVAREAAGPVPLLRHRVYCLSDAADPQRILASMEDMLAEMRRCLPGCELTQALRLDRLPGAGRLAGLQVSILLELAPPQLPPGAGAPGFLDSAALALAERLAARMLRYPAVPARGGFGATPADDPFCDESAWEAAQAPSSWAPFAVASAQPGIGAARPY